MAIKVLCQTVLVALFTLELTTAVMDQQPGETRNISTDDIWQDSSFFLYHTPKYPKDCKEVFQYCNSARQSPGVYLIKPDGFDDPFEVYCNKDLDYHAWTVILRRVNGFVDFDRNWESYKNGFGFLNDEFWLGNEKLAYLTNQADNILRIDIVLSNRSPFYIEHDGFRISDEWSNFTLLSVGMYHGNTNLPISECPPGKVFTTCSCKPSCGNPNVPNDCDDVCDEVEECVCEDGLLKKGDECVPPVGCGCFASETNSVIPRNGTYVNDDCSKFCVCRDDQLTCHSSYECTSAAECLALDGRLCTCNGGHNGVGETCSPKSFTDCHDIFENGFKEDGVYKILPISWPGTPFNVYCDMTTSGGGWTVLLRRIDSETDFYRNWTSYKDGFGSVYEQRDFWLGNEKLYYLTNQTIYTLRADITTSSGVELFEEYESFRIGNESTSYVLHDLGAYTGTAGNGMGLASGHPFSTFDHDDDECVDRNCPAVHGGGWWYSDVNNWCTRLQGAYCANFRDDTGWYGRCTLSNLNGRWNEANGENIFWARETYGYDHTYCRLSFAELKIRPL